MERSRDCYSTTLFNDRNRKLEEGSNERREEFVGGKGRKGGGEA